MEMGWTLEEGEDPGHLNELARPLKLSLKLAWREWGEWESLELNLESMGEAKEEEAGEPERVPCWSRWVVASEE
jgi:hypothetical protein